MERYFKIIIIYTFTDLSILCFHATVHDEYPPSESLLQKINHIIIPW